MKIRAHTHTHTHTHTQTHRPSNSVSRRVSKMSCICLRNSTLCLFLSRCLFFFLNEIFFCVFFFLFLLNSSTLCFFLSRCVFVSNKKTNPKLCFIFCIPLRSVFFFWLFILYFFWMIFLFFILLEQCATWCCQNLVLLPVQFDFVSLFCDITPSYVCHDSFMCMTWLLHM